jgi:IclR family pca regulon transcriptional regulator
MSDGRTGKGGARGDAGADEDEAGGINPRDYVNSLARGLEVLRAFNRTRRRMTLSEVAAETGNTRAGARRHPAAAVPDKLDMVHVGRQFHRVIPVGVTVGARLPAHCTATGRGLLAAQAEECRARLSI